MSSTITKAMLLAAGLGTRLRPLTNSVPKPMLPVNGKPLIDYSLRLLAQGGIKEVTINLHYLPDQIRKHVGDGARYKLSIHYSYEPEIMGTGGGLKNCGEFFGDDPFILMNADTLIDINLKDLLTRHLAEKAIGTLVVRVLGPQDTYRPVDIDRDGRLAGFGRGTHFYAGVLVSGPALIAVLPSGQPCCLIQDGINRLLANGAKFSTYLHEGRWNDVGTPERYEAAKQQGWSLPLLI